MREVIDFVAIEGTRLAPSVVPVVDIRSILLFFFPTAVFCFLASEKIATYFPSKRGGINQGSHAHPDRPRRGPEASCAVQSSLQPINITGVVFSLKFVVCSAIHFNCLDFFFLPLPTTSLMRMVGKSLDCRQQKSAVGTEESGRKKKKN